MTPIGVKADLASEACYDGLLGGLAAEVTT